MPKTEKKKGQSEHLVQELSNKVESLNKKISQTIAEQKIIEDALRDSDEQYRVLAESARDFIFIVDEGLAVRYVNEFGASLFNSKPLDIVGKPLSSLFPAEIYGKFRKSIETVFSDSRTFSAESKVELLNKSELWLETKLTPIPDKNGQIHRILGISRDITERKKAEEELRQSEEKFRTLADTVAAGIAIIKNEKFCYVNQYLLDSTGYTFEELKKKKYLEIVHPDFREIVQSRHGARLRGETLSPRFEFKVVYKNGAEAWVNQSAGLIDFEGDIATLVTIWDITEEKNIKQALGAEKERLDITLGSIGDSVISTDINTNIKTINKAAEFLTGYCKEEAIGRPIDEVCLIVNEKTHDVTNGIFKKIIEQYGIVNYNKHGLLRSKNGADHQIELSVSPIISQENKLFGMVLVFRDVTEKLKLENEIFKVRKLESLGVLAGGIAHDFNNILTGVITNLFMAKCTLPANSENFKLLVDAEKACFRASRLTKQLLTFSKGGTPVKEVASIREVIEETIGFCLSGSNATYSLSLAPDLMAATIDRGQIDQVINNLLINAQQAMPTGGNITVKAENVVVGDSSPELVVSRNQSLNPGKYIKVSIKDEGTGISPKDLEKIFDPYFTTKPNGTGLGLTTSYSIIKNHEGIIAVDSQLGQGSIFSFYLPALNVSLETNTSENVRKKNNTGKILVMDDDEAVRTVVAQILKGFGYQVVCSASGKETIRLYQEAYDQGAPFNAVIMDLTVPGGMGGKEVVKLLADIDPALKAIVTSGYSNDPILANYHDYGFSGMIVKPFVIDDFLRVVQEVLGRN